MKKIVSFLLIIVMMLSFISCATNKEKNKKNKLSVVATLFPQYEFAKEVLGDSGEVTLLLPPGTDAHMYDPAPADIKKIYDCDLLIYTGDDFEPWVVNIISSIKEAGPKVLDLSKSVKLLRDNESDHSSDTDEHHMDAHYWLNIKNSVRMVNAIRETICSLDDTNSQQYVSNAENYAKKLTVIDEKYTEELKNQKKMIAFAGKFAYAYLLNEYHLKYITVYTSCSSEAEPSPTSILETIRAIKKQKVKYIYTEEMSEGKVAKTISEATGATILELHTGHNLSKNDFENGMTFLELLERNLTNLKKGLSE